MGKVRGRLSYANVVASLALFIALGGSSYAAVRNSVGSKHIENGQVKRADLGKSAVDSTKVKDGSLLAADFRTAQLPAGATGPQGPQGAKGDPGTNGANGTNGATNVTVRRSTQAVPVDCHFTGDWECSTADPNGRAVQEAHCAAGERAVSGGYTDLEDVRSSQPIPASGTPTGWRVYFRHTFRSSTDKSPSHSFDVYAVCAAP